MGMPIPMDRRLIMAKALKLKSILDYLNEKFGIIADSGELFSMKELMVYIEDAYDTLDGEEYP
jgi:hypothetical protein